MKKILILYTEYGTAHKMVAKYLEEYLKKEYHDAEVKILDGIKYASPFWFEFYRKTCAENVCTIKLNTRTKIYKYIDKGRGFFSFDKILLKLFANKRLRKFITEYNPDSIVSTIFGTSQIMGYFKMQGLTNAKIMTIITDFEEHLWWLGYHEYANYFIVNSNSIKKSMIERGIQGKKIKVLGVPISKKFNVEYDTKSLKEKLNISDNKPVILVFGGGGCGFDLSLPYYEKVLSLNKKVVSIFIAGKNNKLREKAKKLGKKYQQESHVYGFVDNVVEFMAISDLIVTKPGGLTTIECLTMSKPMICMEAIGPHEIPNYQFVVDNGCGIYCENANELDDIIMDYLEDKRSLKIMHRNFKKLGFTNNIDKVCDLIMKNR